MTFDELADFIRNRMRMSHVYQPVMLIRLLTNRGQATVTDIARSILQHDESQVEYYEKVTNNMVGRVLTSYEIVKKEGSQYILNEYAEREPMLPLDAFEAAAYRNFPPRWNRAVPEHAGPLPELTLEDADAVIGILDSPEELAVRRQPLERIEAKLLHLVRAVRKAKVSGASPGVRQALARHADELAELFRRSLGRHE